MTGATCDVLIAGGGPGGCAAALSLRTHAANLSVVLVEASHYGQLRLGETLPPLAQRLLQHLQVWEVFQRQGHRPVYGTSAVWGVPERYENDFMYTPHSTGWHLDRRAFDAMLAEQATARGVRLLLGVRLTRAEWQGTVWRLHLSNGMDLRSRFVVDATGRRAIFARHQGARAVCLGRLTGFARFFTDP